MLKKVFLLTCHNQYESKRYFTIRLAEAMKRAGLEISILSWDYGPVPDAVIETIKKERPDLTATFHQMSPQSDGEYFWSKLSQPHWTILLDPVFYDLELMKSRYSILSCVDRDDCNLLLSYGFQNVFFFPHAIEKEIFDSTETKKEHDVLFLGTCYDPDSLRKYWKKNYPKKIVTILEEAVDKVLTDVKTPFWRALLQTLMMNGLEPKEVEFDQLAYYVDQCARGIDRLQLIRSIKDVPIDIYGGSCWREEKPIENWSYYLSKQSNVTVHPPVNFFEGLNLMKKGKICLNSMPFFKNGTHERIFASYACGALPLTSDSLYLREIFDEGKEILYYQFRELDEVNEKVALFIKDDLKRQTAIDLGRKKVKELHTWDNRVETLLKEVPPILNAIKE